VFVNLVADIVHEFGGHFDKFTGDGLLAEFFAGDKSEDARRRAVRNAFECAKRLTDEIENFYNDEPWRRMLLNANLVGPKTRASLAWGPVNFGRYGGAGTTVGTPMVVAARLCNHKEFFLQTADRPGTRIVGTGPIVQVLEFRPAEIAERMIQKEWPIEGLAPTDVFRLHP
jgi:class 3 adenylate cyclase